MGYCSLTKNGAYYLHIPGGSSGVDPPVPFSNTVVKRPSADDTALVTVWENRSLPGYIFAMM